MIAWDRHREADASFPFQDYPDLPGKEAQNLTYIQLIWVLLLCLTIISINLKNPTVAVASPFANARLMFHFLPCYFIHRLRQRPPSTSPSIYVKFPTGSALDDCGSLGPVSTSITLAFNPGELSTPDWSEATRRIFFGIYPKTRVLDTNDLPCGPFGGKNPLLVEDFNDYPFYQPLIVLPPKLLNLVPQWSACTGDGYEGQDPPRTLCPAPNMAPILTKAEADPQTTAALPRSSIPPLPAETGVGDLHFADSDPNPTVDSPPRSGDPPSVDPVQRSKPSPEHADSTPAGYGSPEASPGSQASPDHPIDPTRPDTGHASPGDPPNSAAEPSSPAGAKPDAPSIGAGNNRDPPQDTPLHGSDSSNPSPADPSNSNDPTEALPPAIAIQGQTITNGAAPVTIDNKPVTYLSGTLSVGDDVHPISA